MWRKRTIISLVFMLLGLSFLMGRLMQIQLFSTENFTKYHVNLIEESVKQRSQELVIDHGRGEFLYQNGESITNQHIPVLVLFPFLKKMNWDSAKVATIIGVTKSDLEEKIAKAKEPIVYGDTQPLKLTSSQMEKINALAIPGVFAVKKKYELRKYDAEQLIGITGENESLLRERYPDKQLSPQTLMGLSGLEKAFDEFILPEGKAKLVYHVDAIGAPLFGINVKYVEPGNPFYPTNVRTTLNQDLQSLAEKLVDQHGIKNGGLILLDINTNNVLAMVSRPHFNSKDPYKGDALSNKMLDQQIIGSVFKTVVAAAAIDYKLDDTSRLFDCSKKINGDPDLTYHHGMLNFTDSFARSCNRTFGELAVELMEMDPNILEHYASKLNLTGTVGWHGSVFHMENFKQLSEDSGRIFLSEDARTDRNFVALSGIGQNEVRATPLAVANMMSTIAKGGKKEMVRVVSKVEYKNGTTLTEFEKKPIKGEELAPYTAMKLQKLLREVVLNERGTGAIFKDLPFEVAGKSGTAETGKGEGAEQLHNKWFAGYFPFQQPRYALVTVNLDVKADEGAVNPLFADMVKEIYAYEQSQGRQP